MKPYDHKIDRRSSLDIDIKADAVERVSNPFGNRSDSRILYIVIALLSILAVSYLVIEGNKYAQAKAAHQAAEVARIAEEQRLLELRLKREAQERAIAADYEKARRENARLQAELQHHKAYETYSTASSNSYPSISASDDWAYKCTHSDGSITYSNSGCVHGSYVERVPTYTNVMPSKAVTGQGNRVVVTERSINGMRPSEREALTRARQQERAVNCQNAKRGMSFESGYDGKFREHGRYTSEFIANCI